MKVSIITPTYRDTELLLKQAYNLCRQTMPHDDFEWLLIDDFYEDRKEKVASWQTPFPVRHLPPRVYSEYRVPSTLINGALVEAQGELIYFMSDFMQMSDQVLARHWELYQRFGPKVMIGGPIVIAECPACMAENGKTWPIPDDTLFAFPCQSCSVPMVYMRQRAFEYGIEPGLGETFNHDVMRQSFWVGRNESVPLECLLAVNGLDEDLDGRGGDGDLGTRLMNYGCRFLLDRMEIVMMHSHQRGKEDRPRQERPQIQVPGNPRWEAVLAGAFWAHNSWNIRDERLKTSPPRFDHLPLTSVRTTRCPACGRPKSPQSQKCQPCSRMKPASGLTSREKEVLTRRFGLDGQPPRTVSETARVLYLSTTWVEKMEQRALLHKLGLLPYKVSAEEARDCLNTAIERLEEREAQ